MVLSVYMAPALCVTRLTCLMSSFCSSAGTVSSQTSMRTLMGTAMEPPIAGLVSPVNYDRDEHRRKHTYLSVHMSRTPQSLASLSKSRAFHREPNIGPMKRMTGKDASSKLVVVEYVTRSFGWSAVSESHRVRWKYLEQIVRIAWSLGEESASEIVHVVEADILESCEIDLLKEHEQSYLRDAKIGPRNNRAKNKARCWLGISRLTQRPRNQLLPPILY